MKAPDLIYVEFSEDVNLAFEKQPFDETPAYIRKDALLEWIQEASAIPHENAIVRDLAFQEVINKLNSM